GPGIVILYNTMCPDGGNAASAIFQYVDVQVNGVPTFTVWQPNQPYAVGNLVMVPRTEVINGRTINFTDGRYLFRCVGNGNSGNAVPASMHEANVATFPWWSPGRRTRSVAILARVRRPRRTERRSEERRVGKECRAGW